MQSIIKEILDTDHLDLTVSEIDRHEITAKTPNSLWRFSKDEFSEDALSIIGLGTVIRYTSGYRLFSGGLKEHFRQFSVVTP